MKAKLIAAVMLLGAATNSHAGFLDSFFGKKEDAAPAEVKAEAAPNTATSPVTDSAKPGMMETALGLVPTLTSNLGITEKQAEGGMGALLNVAKGNLSGEEFSSLGQGIPGMETLLAAAPALSTKSGLGGLSGLASNLGGAASALSGVGQLSEQFEALGLSPELISQFASVAIEYFMNDDADTGALLSKGLSSVLGN